MLGSATGQGRDFPGTLGEFEQQFATEEACRRYLAKLRWPDGFKCPSCGSGNAWRTARDHWFCGKCRRQTSVTAGTIFDRTRKPLLLWFRVMWLVTSQKTGASALNLQRQLGLRRYETAWTWLHKLRRAMVRPGRDRLAGNVEVDETYVGGVEPGVRGRQTWKKAIVAIAVEGVGTRIGRVRMASIRDVSAASLTPFVRQAAEPGAVVNTDGWKGYSGLTAAGYVHTPKNVSASGDPAHVVMPAVHRVAALLKRWLLGTHQGSVSREHLDYYLDEFTFRFNRRTSRQRGQLFYRLAQQAVAVGPTTWAEVAAAKRGGATTGGGN